ncbi:MAG TPA: hypothetical protein VGI58_01205 [Streptosporangiaceae bacterium]|jgi:hypothetical protein
MISRASAARPLQLVGRATVAAKSARPASLLVITLALIFGGTGLASATTGGSFILGRANSEATTAKLANSRGTPLALSAPKGKPPLAVNRSALVGNLNANYVGGLSAGSLKVTGGDGFTDPNADVALGHDNFTAITSTGRLPAGTYYVTATALISLTSGDTGASCQVIKDGLGQFVASGGSSGSGFVQAVETGVVQLGASGVLTEACIASGSGSSGTEVIDAGITAVRILSSSGAKPTLGGGV